MALVSAGAAKDAVELLEKHSPSDTLNEQGKESLQKQFSLLSGGGEVRGPGGGGVQEVPFAALPFLRGGALEKTGVVFSYLFGKTIDQGWKIHKLTVADGVDNLEKVVPFVPLGPARTRWL